MTQDKAAQLERHIQFELQLWQGEGLRQTLEMEIAALFGWFSGVTLNDLISAADVRDIHKRNVVERSMAPGIPIFAAGCARRVREVLEQDTVRLEDLLSKDLYDRIIASVSRLDTLRNEVVHQAVSSTIFSMLIAETLHGGIKAFMSDNVVTKNVPGAASLFDLGKGMLNKATFGLSENIAGRLDEQIREFINENISNQLKNSEAFLVTALDQELIKKSAEEAWQKINEYDSNSWARFVEQGHLDAMSPLIQEFWQNFRGSSVYMRLSDELIRYFFELYGDRKIRDVLSEFGVTHEIALDEACRTAIPLLEKALVQEYLEQRIRKRLERFYLKDGKED